MNNQTVNANIISVEYTDKIKRDERKASGENFIFLDFSQKLFMQIQRREKATLLLDAMGTWRNSLFVLIGQHLYINFNRYNENKMLEPSNRTEEILLCAIYSMQGKMPSYILECRPAGVVKNGNSWQILKKGGLLLKK